MRSRRRTQRRPPCSRLHTHNDDISWR